MPNFYFDCEFIEGFKKPMPFLPTIGKFNKPYYQVQLISIGIVRDDNNKTYYAISNEFDYRDANQWTRQHVLYPLLEDEAQKYNAKASQYLISPLPLDLSAIKVIQKAVGKSHEQIAKEIKDFVYGFESSGYTNEQIVLELTFMTPVRFYAYYAHFDYVLFSSLFGTMREMPKGFPRHVIDLKQMLDERVEAIAVERIARLLPNNFTASANFSPRQKFRDKLSAVMSANTFPRHESADHNALEDAHWNQRLHYFINTSLAL